MGDQTAANAATAAANAEAQKIRDELTFKSKVTECLSRVMFPSWNNDKKQLNERIYMQQMLN